MTSAPSKTKGFGVGKKSRKLPATVTHISGLALLAISPGLLVSAIVEAAGGGSNTASLLISALVFALLGAAMRQGTRIGDLSLRTVFAAVGWSWLLVSVLGALPFVLARTFERDGIGRWIEIGDAIFESTSGYTCTGSTVLTTLPDLGGDDTGVGKGILFYRQLTQWYGGMGFVQLVVAVLPSLGSKALGFMGAESPGPTSDRLAPHAADTAKILWKLYVVGTVVMAFAFTVAGMFWWDGVTHALTTAATGGFSTYNDSLGEFDSLAIEVVAQVSMLFGGTNWALHYLFLTKRRSVHREDHEFRTYIALFVIATGAITLMLNAGEEVGSFGTALRMASFNVASLISSTGFGNAQGSGTPGDFVLWSAAPLSILMLIMVVGGMSGSTAGGIKVIRLRVLLAISKRTLTIARQPHAVVPVKMGGQSLAERVVSRVSLFMMAYAALVVGGFLLVTALGGGVEESIGGVIGSLGNMGPAFGSAGPTATFLDAFPAPARMVLVALMLIGRLELFAVLLMFSLPKRVAQKALPHKHTF